MYLSIQRIFRSTIALNGFTAALVALGCVLLFTGCQEECPMETAGTTFSRTFGGSDFDVANSIQQTSDGGYIITGRSNSSDGDVRQNNGKADFWIVKLDRQGTLEWEQAYGGPGDDEAKSIQQTFDGGYIVAGYTNGDVTDTDKEIDANAWVLKLDAQGTLVWEQTYGGPGYDEANSIQQTPDGGYIVAGASEASGEEKEQNKRGQNIWILKLDDLGSLQWKKSYGGPGNDRAHSIQLTFDGGYIVAGVGGASGADIEQNKGESDFLIVKLDDQGTLEWEQSYGGSGQDAAFSIQPTLDGGYIVAGHALSSDGDIGENKGQSDFWVLKLAASGTLEWEQSYGGSTWDGAHSIQQTYDGNYVVAGYTVSSDGDVSKIKGGSDLWILKLNGNGTLKSEQTYGGSIDDQAHSFQLTSDGGYILAGYSLSSDGDVMENKGNQDLWVMKLDDPENL